MEEIGEVKVSLVNAYRVVIKGAVKRYGSLAALNDFDLTIEPGTFTVLLGPSGSGKSTLIRSIAGIERLDSGTIHFGDREIAGEGFHMAPEKRDLAMVFQDYALWPHMTSYENIGYALKRRNLDSTESDRRINEALDRVGLSTKGSNYPFQLSGGEQQRLCIARALALDPEVLLMDEPTSALDPIATLRIEELMVTLKERVTIIIVTHNMQQAARISDDCAFLLMGEDRAGELIEFDTTEKIFNNPKDSRTLDYTLGRFG